MQVLFCSPLDCRQGAWKECGKYEEENAFRYQRLMDCPVLLDGENVFCTSLSMTILTVVMTVFVSTNIKKWNAEFQIIYVTARLRKRSRKKAYNFRIN